MRAKLQAIGYLLLLAFFGGSFAALTKYALQTMPLFGFTFLRFLCGLGMAYAILRLFRRNLSWHSFRAFAPVASLWWLNAILFPAGLQRTSATTAQFIHIAVPVITAVLAGFILRRHLQPGQWLGVAIAAAGVSLVVLSGGQLSLHSQYFSGNLIILLSAFVFATYAIYSSRQAFAGMHPMEMICIASLCGALVTLPAAIWELAGNPWPAQAPAAVWWAVVAASAGLSVFYGGFQLLIRRYGPAYATLNLYLLPGFVIFWAALILGEKPGWQALAGALVALAGVTIVTHYTRYTQPSETRQLAAAETPE